MREDIAALAELVSIQAMMNRQFLSHLVWRLCRDVPGFDGGQFLEQLYIPQGNMPTPVQGDAPEYRQQCELGLREWEKLVEMAEQAIADATNPEHD